MRTLLTLLVAGAIVAGPEPASAQEPGTNTRAFRAAVAEAQRSGTASQRQDFREQTERTTRTFRGSQELQLANVSGDIMITRGGGNEIAVEIIKTARGRDDADARELLQLVEVDIAERNNRVEVRTRYPQGDEMRRNNRRNFNVSVAYNVTAPAGARVRATSISGAITAKDIRGDVSAESVSGTVRIINGGRVASAKSISGDVEVTESEIDGSLNASTASGSVVLRKVKARQVEVGSISGDVVIEDVDAAQVEGQTVSGSVRFGGALARGGRYELTSHSGTLTVGLAADAGFEVEATSFSGSIRSDFSFGNSGDSERGRWRRSVRGVVGDGSSVVEVTTFSGSIVIGKR
jgi:Putative adhesin